MGKAVNCFDSHDGPLLPKRTTVTKTDTVFLVGLNFLILKIHCFE